jgi:5-carboxymethyl-2-hydroxymuconate isomerase
MASVDPKIIQDIRIRKQAQELIKKSDEFKALRERLVELSGIKERGFNLDELKVSDEQLATLVKAAEESLNKGKLFDTEETSSTDSTPARARRQHI